MLEIISGWAHIRQMRYFWLVVAVLLLGGPATAAKKCTPWTQLYTRPVAIPSFKNDTAKSADDWLSFGLSDLLQRYLTAQGEFPPIQIEGMFQRRGNWLRIFVTLKNGEGKLLAIFPFETPYPYHHHFFSGLREVAQNILRRTDPKKKIPTLALRKIERETSSLRAYENTIRGHMELRRYDKNRMEAAHLWFEEALREDRRYLEPYLGLMEIDGFFYLQHKIEGKPYEKDLEALEETLRKIKRWTGAKIENRHLAAHVSGILSKRYLERGQLQKAVNALEEGLRLLPQDISNIDALAEIYDRMGDKAKAENYSKKAKEMRPCL